MREIELRVKFGSTFAGVVLSHHHNDHIAGALQLEAPIYCHPETMAYLPSNIPTPRNIEVLQEKLLGNTLLRFHHTPGHAPGHLALELPLAKTLLAGDMISSLSSIVIPERTGNLTHYLQSLEKLKTLDCHLVVPAHGPPWGKDSAPFEQALLHRSKREAQILQVLGKGSRVTSELVKALYPGLNPALAKAANSNIGHYLRKLESENRVESHNDSWTLKPSE